MKPSLVLVFFCLFTLAVTSHATTSFGNPIRLVTDDDDQTSHMHAEHITAAPIHLLKPKSGIPQINCLSWNLAVETNNLRNWSLVPVGCECYVGNYMLGMQYSNDCEFVADIAIKYAKNLTLVGDGKEIWVFDIDETTLSNLPYYARPDVQFGALPPNYTKFNEWVETADAPAIPAALRLYETVLALGIKPVFLSGTREEYRHVRVKNLKKAGYSNWEKLILSQRGDNRTAGEYKSSERTKLVELDGYRIVGNIGDQWSDLLGANVGNRTFKLPNPMYFFG